MYQTKATKRMIHKLVLVFLIGFIQWLSISAQTPYFEKPLSPRIASYDIDVTLDTDKKMLYAKETLYWKNPSADTIRELHFHLYLNAFKNTKSTFLRDANWVRRMSPEELAACEWGWVNVDKIRDENGIDLTPNMRYIQPDDGNEDDETVLLVPLAEPVMPYDSINIYLDFTVKIPKVMARTGYSREFFFMAQWFPKVGVYEPAGMRYAEKGQWNCHQYHSNSEYYSDFGVYNVAMTVPSHYTVGSSGLLQKITDNGNTNTHLYRAEDVIDFTWTASPDFIEYTDTWKHVNIRLLTHAGHEVFAERFLNTAKYSLEYFEEYLEIYPYPTLTIVESPYHGMFTGAMEYPTLITILTLRGMPGTIRLGETFLVHEFTHQYFMQMVATNEQEEKWMDEGFTTYWEGRIMDHYYGEQSSTFDIYGVKSGNVEYHRIEYYAMDNPQVTSCANTGWEMKRKDARTIAYNKTGVVLRTLEGLVGWDTMKEIMKTYFQRWKFKHPCGYDFVDVANEVVVKRHGDEFGENLDWFFDQMLYGTEMCDFELADISNREIKSPVGFIDGDCVTELSESDDKQWKSSVTVYQRREAELPVEVLIHFDNGDEVTEFWDGKDGQVTFEYKGSRKIEWAIADPEQKMYIDLNFNNNSLTIKPQKKPVYKYVLRFLNWLQNTLQTAVVFS